MSMTTSFQPLRAVYLNQRINYAIIARAMTCTAILSSLFNSPVLFILYFNCLFCPRLPRVIPHHLYKGVCNLTLEITIMLTVRFLRILAIGLAFITAAQADELTIFWRRYGATKPIEENGCKDRHQKLSNSWREAARMINKANDAIKYLKDSPKPGLKDKKGRWDWNRRARTMKSFFAIDISSKGGPETNSLQSFEFVERIFGEMKDGMDNDRPSTPRPDPTLLCGDKGWTYYPPDKDYPSKPGTKTGDIKNDDGKVVWPRGMWWFQGRVMMLPSQTPTNRDFCTGKNLAFTIASISMITFCEEAWGRQGVDDFVDPKKVQKNNPLYDTPRQTAATIWIHELAHFYGQYPRGNELPDQQLYGGDHKPVEGHLTYGVIGVMNLAIVKPELAAHTAEAYNMFALAMSLPDWDWSTGEAKEQGQNIFDRLR
ncbi:hypothetical protein GGR52DRAFT_525598 [Hypoxylon sp. FL1284]|nr:hypothetical protein GGR52DRAFT_525598 [Hypoxylon sp. FL1284]